jgi:hypothetical protein
MRSQIALALAALGACAPAAAAAGFPVGVDTTQAGATTPGGAYRYLALPSGKNTVVARVNRVGGEVVRFRTLHGAFAVAAVSQDSSTTGLSADGSTLVLTSVRTTFPARSTRLIVLNANTLKPQSETLIRGDFGLDAVSPDGRWAYFIQYRSGDPTNYAVRSYDLSRGRLAPKPIVDARNPDEKMVGFPATRAMSADGRWAYTLYGASSEPFVHALDTTNRRAFCVDLPGVAGDAVFEMRLAVRHGRVDVLDRAGAAVRHIDATTFKVTKPRAAAVPAPARPPAAPSDGFPWLLAAVTAAVAAGLAALARRRYRGGTATGPSAETSSSSATLP